MPPLLLGYRHLWVLSLQFAHILHGSRFQTARMNTGNSKNPVSDPPDDPLKLPNVAWASLLSKRSDVPVRRGQGRDDR